MIRLQLIFYGIIIFLLIGMVIYIRQLHSKIDNLESYKSIYKIDGEPNKIWKDKDSTWHDRSNVAEVSKSELKNIKDLQNLPNEFDGLKKSMKNLENYVQVSQSTIIHSKTFLKDTTIYTVDSIKIKAQESVYTTKWDTISCLIEKDTIEWKIVHHDKLKAVKYWDRKWFLGKKKEEIEFKNENPDTKIEYQKDIEVKRKRGLFR